VKFSHSHTTTKVQIQCLSRKENVELCIFIRKDKCSNACCLSTLVHCTSYNSLLCTAYCTWADYLIPGLIFFPGNYNTQRKGNRGRYVANLYKCMCKTGGRYLPTFTLWRPLGERLQQCASHFTMEEKVQRHVCIDFCFHLGKTGAEMYEMLQAAF